MKMAVVCLLMAGSRGSLNDLFRAWPTRGERMNRGEREGNLGVEV